VFVALRYREREREEERNSEFVLAVNKEGGSKESLHPKDEGTFCSRSAKR
jgi:hypothetical protein